MRPTSAHRGAGWKLAAALAAAALLLLPAAAQAATITPNTATDEVDAGGTCSLREAVSSINAGADTGGCVADVTNAYGIQDTIVLGSGTYQLTRSGVDDTNVGGDLDVIKSLTISGAGDGTGGNLTTIDANHLDRAVDVGASGAVSLTVQQIAITNGQTTGEGGAIRSMNPLGTLTVTDSTIASSSAGTVGGGIALGNESTTILAGHLVITRTEIDGNTAGDDGGGIFQPSDAAISTYSQDLFAGNTSSGKGGGLYEQGSPTTSTTSTITNTTFNGNSAVQGGGGFAQGFNGASANLNFVTFDGNSTSTASGDDGAGHFSGGGAVLMDGGTTQAVDFIGTLLAHNTAAGVLSNCSGPPPPAPSSTGLQDIGNNLESGDTCHFLASKGSLVNTDPLLAPLADNTGQTRTQGLYDTSPAIDLVPSPPSICGQSTLIDQRGVTRPAGSGCDAGAFEGSIGPVPTPPPGGGGGGGESTPPTTSPTTSTTPPTTKKKCKKKKRHSAFVAKKCKKKRK